MAAVGTVLRRFHACCQNKSWYGHGSTAWIPNREPSWCQDVKKIEYPKHFRWLKILWATVLFVQSMSLRRRTQLREEAVDKFYRAQCNMIKKCNYHSAQVQEQLVQGPLVVGLHHLPQFDLLCRISKLVEAQIQAHQCKYSVKDKRQQKTGGNKRQQSPEQSSQGTKRAWTCHSQKMAGHFI